MAAWRVGFLGLNCGNIGIIAQLGAAKVWCEVSRANQRSQWLFSIVLDLAFRDLPTCGTWCNLVVLGGGMFTSIGSMLMINDRSLGSDFPLGPMLQSVPGIALTLVLDVFRIPWL